MAAAKRRESTLNNRRQTTCEVKSVFHTIHPAILERMRCLEQIDARDRADGTPRLQRLRQIPPETGRFLAILAAGAPGGTVLEVGASAGYSTLWLSLACEAQKRTLTTFEVLPAKAQLARETFRLAGVEATVTLVQGNARECIESYQDVALCFLDTEKEIYGAIYEAVVPRLVKGGLLLADNAINHRQALQPMLDRALSDERVDALVVPIGNGVLVCRKV
ncbi:MAG: O-methyltransferase [Anaerolineae bacterium]